MFDFQSISVAIVSTVLEVNILPTLPMFISCIKVS